MSDNDMAEILSDLKSVIARANQLADQSIDVYVDLERVKLKLEDALNQAASRNGGVPFADAPWRALVTAALARGGRVPRLVERSLARNGAPAPRRGRNGDGNGNGATDNGTTRQAGLAL
jgi:hypothetical protein